MRRTINNHRDTQGICILCGEKYLSFRKRKYCTNCQVKVENERRHKKKIKEEKK